MGEQNDTRISPFKTIIEEIEGFNSFIKEMLDWIGTDPERDWMKKTLIEELLATGWDLLGYIHESVEETESGPTKEVEEIERFLQSLNVMADCLDTSNYGKDWNMAEPIGALLAKIEDTEEKILKKYIQAKVGEMKQRLDQARSAVKVSRKAAGKDEVHDESKKLGDDKL